MPQNPLQPHDDDPHAWHNRLIAEVLASYARKEFELAWGPGSGPVAKAVPKGLMRRMRKLIVRAGQEHARHLLFALHDEVRFKRGAMAALFSVLEATDPFSALAEASAVVGRVGVLESSLESSRSEARRASARADAAESECVKLRLLLEARSAPEPKDSAWRDIIDGKVAGRH